jgi:hypothetical protein
MRGPGYKLTGDVRRTWRCPKCGAERKLQGEVTTLVCHCDQLTWMRIVSERTMVPRPLQRPSDVERRPIDFGIEPPPPQPAREEATIIKPAITRDPEPNNQPNDPPVPPTELLNDAEDDWGEGIL